MKTKTTTKKSTPAGVPMSQQDVALRQAVNDVYKKYGTDLDSFFRDVDAELEIKRQEPAHSDV